MPEHVYKVVEIVGSSEVSVSKAIDRAIEELAYVHERGAKIFLLRVAPVPTWKGRRSFALPEFDSFWARVQELDGRGKTVRIVSRAKRTRDGIRLRVRAEVLDKTELLASVAGTSNLILLDTDLMGTVGTVSIQPTVEQTAYGLFSDLVDVARQA